MYFVGKRVVLLSTPSDLMQYKQKIPLWQNSSLLGTINSIESGSVKLAL
jgi:hypothetical protein